MNVWQFLALARTEHEFSFEELKDFNERISAMPRHSVFTAVEVLEKRLQNSCNLYHCAVSGWIYPDYQSDSGVGASEDFTFCNPYMESVQPRQYVYAEDRHGDRGWCYRDNTFWIEREDQYVTARLFRAEYFGCRNCGERCNREDDDARYSDRLEEYYCSPSCMDEAEAQYLDDDEDEDEDQTIQSYSTRIEHILPMQLIPKQRYFGIELEMEFPDRHPDTEATWAMECIPRLSSTCIWKSDGSLSNGAELVSLPKLLSYWQGDNPVKALCKDANWRRIARSHNTTTCGLHVHVSRSSIPEPVIAKIVYLMNEPCMNEIVTLVARRSARSTYSVASKKRWHSDYNMRERQTYDANLGVYVDVPAWKRVRNCGSVCKTQTSQDARYTPVNLTRNTIEFRIFKGTLKWETVLASIEFCEAVISYCTQYGAAKMNDRDFSAWLRTAVTRKTYPALRDYLTTRTLLPTRRQKPADVVTPVTLSEAFAI